MLGGKLTSLDQNYAAGSKQKKPRRNGKIMGKTSCEECCGRIFLVIFNIFFVLIGFILFTLGLVIIFGWPLIGGFIEPYLQALTEMESSGTTTTSSTTTASSSSTDTIKDAFNVVAYILIGLGAAMLLIGSCGCCGACCSVKCMLITYIIVLFILMVTQIIIVALWFDNVFDYPAKNKMRSMITTNYEGIKGFNTDSLLLNYIMIQLECCGVDNYMDFDSASKWERNITISGVDITMVTPLACCKVTGSFPSITPVDTNCTVDPRPDNSNYWTGCWDQISQEINDQSTIIIAVISVLCVLEFGLMAVACYVLIKGYDRVDEKSRLKNNKVHPEPQENNNQPNVQNQQPGWNPSQPQTQNTGQGAAGGQGNAPPTNTNNFQANQNNNIPSVRDPNGVTLRETGGMGEAYA